MVKNPKIVQIIEAYNQFLGSKLQNEEKVVKKIVLFFFLIFNLALFFIFPYCELAYLMLCILYISYQQCRDIYFLEQLWPKKFVT